MKHISFVRFLLVLLCEAHIQLWSMLWHKDIWMWLVLKTRIIIIGYGGGKLINIKSDIFDFVIVIRYLVHISKKCLYQTELPWIYFLGFVWISIVFFVIFFHKTEDLKTELKLTIKVFTSTMIPFLCLCGDENKNFQVGS